MLKGKYKKGDVVICTNNEFLSHSSLGESTDLTIGKEYTIIRVGDEDTIRIMNDNNKNFGYYIERFMTLKEYRKAKLKKINKYNEQVKNT